MPSRSEDCLSNRVFLAAVILILILITGIPAPAALFGQEMAVTKIKVISVPSQSKEIRPLRFFPTENDEAKEVFLTQAQYMSSDSNGRIYVSDVKANEVLVFDKDGRFVRKIGRTGQGPGEFNLVGRPGGRLLSERPASAPGRRPEDLLPSAGNSRKQNRRLC